MLQKSQIKNIQKALYFGDSKFPMIFDALSDPNRFCIFKLLNKYKDLCVTDISAICGISVPATSQHLRILEMSGLVRRERKGQMICYKIKNESLVKSLIKIIS